MKSKAYKLAAELGLNESRVLDWLRANGYPNVRRADTIRSEVAQAARNALGRSRGRPTQTSIPGRAEGPRRSTGRPPRGNTGGGNTGGGNTGGGRGDPSLRVSFAELLEAHLPGGVGSEAEGPRRADTLPSIPPVGLPSVPARQDAAQGPAAQGPAAQGPATQGRAINPDAVAMRVSRLESERDEARRSYDGLRRHSELQSQELVALRESLSEAKRNLNAITALRAEVERLQLERARLRQALNEASDERETLAQTCAELQQELRSSRETVSELEQAQGVSDSATGDLQGDLDAARQREIAWRARALELERASQAGGTLSTLFQGEGLTHVDDHLRVISAVVASPESGRSFLRSLRQVDAAAIKKLLGGRIVRCCADPICGQVLALDGVIGLRVDAPDRCSVCEGDPHRRWFLRMVRECERAGVRRLLLIGGSDSTQDALRRLSQGQPVDLRLVPAEEEATPARVQGRVEGCDLLVTWPRSLVPPEVTEPYHVAADALGTPSVRVLGRRFEVSALSRAVANRLARTHLLRAR